MKETILKMCDVSKRFPGVIALNDVSINLYKSEILGICGENGAGKSTLMKILSGSYPHSEYEGELIVSGNQVKFDSVSSAQRNGIEMVYQELNMMLDASIAENLFVGNLHGNWGIVNHKELYRQARDLLDSVGLDFDVKMAVRTLNSGQMQLLAILRACAKNPKILVLDEPTSALTDQEVEKLFLLLERLCSNGVSCIYISHKLDELYRICNRVTVLRDGQVISCRDVDQLSEKTLIEEMVGRTVENLYPKLSIPIDEEVFRVENLSVPHPNIKGKNIVENISFSLRKGEILGIGGLVGAGRSEILGAIFGQYSKNVTKDVYINRKKVVINKPSDAIKAGVGFVTEERKINGFVWMLNIRENMSLASLPDLPGKIFINRKTEMDKTQNLFTQLLIKAPSLETKVVNLSGGNQQKVVIGKWLLKAPQILFVDEPTKGIDVGARAEIYKLMSNLASSGVSIIMVSSDMPELVNMSDRCIVMSGGRISGEFEGDDITDAAILQAAIR